MIWRSRLTLRPRGGPQYQELSTLTARSPRHSPRQVGPGLRQASTAEEERGAEPALSSCSRSCVTSHTPPLLTRISSFYRNSSQLPGTPDHYSLTIKLCYRVTAPCLRYPFLHPLSVIYFSERKLSKYFYTFLKKVCILKLSRSL